jgi:gas vesicle protein
MTKIEAWYDPPLGALIIKGDTFQFKETIKGLGFKWDSVNKVWKKDVSPRDVAKTVKEVQERLGVKVRHKPLQDSVDCLEYVSIVLQSIAMELEGDMRNEVTKIFEAVSTAFKELREKISEIELSLLVKG